MRAHGSTTVRLCAFALLVPADGVQCDAMQLIFDLVFIDDWHAYEHVRTELQLLEVRIPATLAAQRSAWQRTRCRCAALRCAALRCHSGTAFAGFQSTVQ